uniref:Uncharacterized protein n=1 Tax=Anguilla anguilla TaxID=7936 RepID=A0A0E9VZT9_ANGAN
MYSCLFWSRLSFNSSRNRKAYMTEIPSVCKNV